MVVADLSARPAPRPGAIVMPGETEALGSSNPALSVERQRAAPHLPLGVMAWHHGRDPEGLRRIAAAHSSTGRDGW